MTKTKKPDFSSLYAPLPVKISNRFHQDLYKIYELSEFIRVDIEMRQPNEKA